MNILYTVDMKPSIMFYFAIIIGLILADQTAGLTKPSSVRLENNEYTGIVIAIHPNETEDEKLIEAISVSFGKKFFHFNKIYYKPVSLSLYIYH